MSAFNKPHHYMKGMKLSAELVEDGFDVSAKLKQIMMEQFEAMLDEALIREGTLLNRYYKMDCYFNRMQLIHDIRWESKAYD